MPDKKPENRFSDPLSPADLERLPDKMRLRYWAGEVGHGIVGLSAVDRDRARRECREWLDWIDRLQPGGRARYVGIASALAGEVCEVAAAWRAPGSTHFSIASPKFADRFLVGPTDLAPAA